jgi:hypothetical protein
MTIRPSHVFLPDELPTLLGSPYSPRHPAMRRACYAALAIFLGITASFGNSLVSANSSSLAGSLDMYAFEFALLPAVYVTFNACANLMLIKARLQFCIPRVTQACLIA